jgi:hypothetical protein
MSHDCYFIHTSTQDSLGDLVQALFAHPCGPSTPTHGQLVHSEGPDAEDGYCGVLMWTDEGTLKLVGVQPQRRRKGIATALWNQARELSSLPLDKAPVRSALGEAWLQSLDIDTPLEVLTGPMDSRDDAVGTVSGQLGLDDVDATAQRIAELLDKGPDVLPYIQAQCAPTIEDTEEQLQALWTD